MSALGAALSLRERVLRASSWSLAGYGLSQAIRLGSNLIMTRLLAPEMFGVMAIAVTLVAVINLLSDVGLHPAIVQSRRAEDPRFLDTAFAVQIVRGALLWAIALAAGLALHAAGAAALLPAGSALADPVLPPLIAVTSASALILGFQSTRVALAHRNFDQRLFIRIELAAQLAGFAATLALAVATRSVWALAGGWLVAAAAQVALSHAWTGRPANRLRLERAALAELLGYGRWVFLSSAIFALASNGDRLMLSALMPADLLGLYAIAALLVAAVEGGATRLFGAVSLPALSEIARTQPARLRETYYRLRLPSDLALLFLSGLLLAAGTAVIALLYDPRYAGAGAMLQALAVQLFAARYGVAHQVYLATGRPRYLVAVNAVRLASLVALVPALYALGGTLGAVWAVGLHGLATIPAVLALNARLGLNDARRELAVLPALAAGWLCGAALSLLHG
jgi:O-antigen/teichoic acid export membrane protein